MPFDAGYDLAQLEAPPGIAAEPGVSETARPHRRVYAALDLGTNNCRLLIARPGRQGFYIVDAFSRVVRLGEGLIQTGRLSDEAQARSIEALKICADKLRRRQVWLTRNVATEACRRASNGPEFVARVYDETGIMLDVISPAEEARLAVLGCQSLLDSRQGRAIVFDIGGGSTEIILVDTEPRGRAAVRAWTSIPWGVVSLAETEPELLSDTEARLESFARMRARVAAHLDEFAEAMRLEGASPRQMLGTSGTVTTLASIQLGLPFYDRRKVDGCWVQVPGLRAISQSLAAKSNAERAQLPCIGKERADLVVAGCAILEAILDLWPVDRIRVADRGIREGILRTLMSRDNG